MIAPKLAVPPVSCTPCATGRPGACTCHDRCTSLTCNGLYFDASEYRPSVHPPVTFEGRVYPAPSGAHCVGCGHNLSDRPDAAVVTFEYALGDAIDLDNSDLAYLASAAETRHFICDSCAPWIQDV